MSPKHPKPESASSSNMELPQAVIAQAEAAATSNQEDGSGHPVKPMPKTSRETMRPKDSTDPSLKTGHAQANRPSALEETPIEQIPPVVYGSQLGQVDFSQDGFDTKAKVAGRVYLARIERAPD